VVAGFVLLSLVGVWIGSNLLSKTPLRVLPGPKGTFVAWGGLVGLAFLFSRAVPPVAGGDRVPDRPQAGLERAPDVILLLVDTLRADALGVYGAGPEATPALDALARDAVVFDQSIAAASWTRPAVASLLTSRWPSGHRCLGKDSMLAPEIETLAETLQGAGYATGGFPNSAHVTAAVGFGQGFDWYPYDPTWPLGAAESSYGLTLYAAARVLLARLEPARRVQHHYHPAEEQLPRALDWVRAQNGARSFLFVHLMEPHDPYFAHPYDGTSVSRATTPDPPPSGLAHHRRLYAGEVAHVDAEIGRFLDALRAEGRYDRSLIVVTADHGEEFLDHGGWWHGTSLYEEQIHVPLLVKLPGNARAGTRVPWQVRSVDIAPTVVATAGLSFGAGWVGDTLFPDELDSWLALLRPPVTPALEGAAPEGAPSPGPTDAEPYVPPTWADHPGSRPALAEQDFDGYALRALRSDGRKLVRVDAAPPGQPSRLPRVACYDLLADPGERRNRAGDGSGCEIALEPLLEAGSSVGEADGGAYLGPAHRARLEALGYAGSATSGP